MTTPAKRPRLLVVLKRSSYKRYVEEERDKRVTELVEARDPSVGRMLPGHIDHEETIEEVRAAIDSLGAEAHNVDNPTSFELGPDVALVVTVGGDGTLLAASHLIGPDTPLLGVNSAPKHSVGFFCAATKGSVRETLAAALVGKLPRVSLTRMRVELNGTCIDERVLNEALFSHSSPAATSRYILRVVAPDGTWREEEQKSSGVWCGPAAGSTAAQKSAGGRVLSLSSTKLQFVVREPYTPHGETLALTHGLIDEGGSLVLTSKMRDAKIFLDGDHLVYGATIGDVVTMRRSAQTLTVLGLTRNGSRR
jgi:NAD+ kinase